jgi:hypothetical protein
MSRAQSVRSTALVGAGGGAENAYSLRTVPNSMREAMQSSMIFLAFVLDVRAFKLT